LLELVLEASGARKEVDKIFERAEKFNKTLERAVYNIDSAMKEIAKTFSLEQMSEFNQTGYTFLTRKQMDQLYGRHGE
jgi:DNA anti-recombination protein RmuC